MHTNKVNITLVWQKTRHLDFIYKFQLKPTLQKYVWLCQVIDHIHALAYLMFLMFQDESNTS